MRIWPKSNEGMASSEDFRKDICDWPGFTQRQQGEDVSLSPHFLEALVFHGHYPWKARWEMSDNGWGIRFDFSSATEIKRVCSSHKSIILLHTTHLIKLGKC